MASYLPMLQQFFAVTSGNNTVSSPAPPANVTVPPLQESASFPNDFSSIIAFFYSYSALRDWLKLIVMGGLFESFRRLLMTGYYKFLDSFFIRASFDNNDPSYEWILVWLSKQPSWSKTRDMQITTRASGGNSPAVVLDGEEDNSVYFKSSRKIAYLPTASLTYSLWYKRRWMTITRLQQSNGIYGEKENTLHISILAWNHAILTDLLQEARRFYMAGQEHSMCIYVSDSGNQWNHVACRAKRSLNSIVLDPGVKDVLLEDARDFLQSKSWYMERGIPFRRGYLLYGSPGSGKTSMIHCMAGELKLDVYIISLSRSGLDDTSLSALVNALPERCIALMEDIDAAFTHGVSRSGMSEDDKGKDEGDGDAKKAPGPPSSQDSPSASTSSKLSLSGLLNALDGVGAQEGRILFATTNRYSALDQALCRPGRMDLHIEFKNASKYQARELFSRFYLPTPPSTEGTNSTVTAGKVDDSTRAIKEKHDEDEASIATQTIDLSLFTGQTHTGRAPTLTHLRISELAEEFASAIPERECSMASLQGYLMLYKTRPVEAAAGAAAWVEKEREGRQKREGEREAKEKKDKEEEKGNEGEEEKKETETEKESKVPESPPAAQPTITVHTLIPCNCRLLPTCGTCGGVKPGEDVVVALPSPISKPASPLASPPEQLAPEDVATDDSAIV